MKNLHTALFTVAAVCTAQSLAHAVEYNVQLDTSKVGSVKQGDVPAANGPGGANSCVPAAVANTLVYMQNQYPTVYNTSLVGNASYSSVAGVGTTLASSSYMNTGSTSGTTAERWISGQVSYLQSVAPSKTVFGGMGNFGINTATYPWFNNAEPTFSFLYNSLKQGAGVTLGMLKLADGIGHAVTLTGMNWNDADNDGMIDKAENATMNFVDPGDGAVHTRAIWQNWANEGIHTDYFNVGQDTGALVLATTTTAVGGEAPAAVPEASTLALLGLGAVGLLRRRR